VTLKDVHILGLAYAYKEKIHITTRRNKVVLFFIVLKEKLFIVVE